MRRRIQVLGSKSREISVKDGKGSNGVMEREGFNGRGKCTNNVFSCILDIDVSKEVNRFNGND